MKSLGLSRGSSWAIAANRVTGCIFITCLVLVDSLAIASKAIAQPVNSVLTCPQLTNRRYAVMLDLPANRLPQLPEFLVIAAAPCAYLNNYMTFFGGFDNAKAATFRANQLRELRLDAVVHSFSTKVNDIPADLQSAMVLVELNNEPNTAIQQVQSLTGKGAVLAAFNNRSVLLTAPLSSQQSANAIASRLRSQGLAAQVISASLLSSTNPVSSTPQNPVPTSPVPNSTATIYRILVPNTNADILKKMRAIAPDAFVTIFKGRSYVQVQTYNNRSNAHRERDRLNALYPNTILLQD